MWARGCLGIFAKVRAPTANADSECRHLLERLADLPEKSLLTADAGFISDFLCALLIETEHPFVLRIGGNKTLIENLDEHETQEGIVSFWPNKDQSQPPLKVRKICFLSRGGLPVVLVTNVLDPEVLNEEDAQEIYKSRWGIEVYFRHLKQTLDFGTMLSRTPATASNEMSWRRISFWSLQRMMVSHQIAAGKNPRRFSAASARREIRDVLQLMQLGKYEKSLEARCQDSQIDTYSRTGPKTTREWPRKKNDKPPKPPKIRTATKQEIQKVKQLGFRFLLIS